MKDFETPEHALAYLMGVYLSDGSLGSEGGLRLDVTDEVFRDEAARAFKVLGSTYGLGVGPYYVKANGEIRRPYRVYERAPYKVGDWLEKEFPDGKDHLPNVPDDLVRDLVAGILDGDGCISRNKRGYFQLQVCGYSDYLVDLEELLDEFGVIMYHRLGGITHTINLRSFVEEGFYFRMPRKQALVEEYTKRYTKGAK